MKCPETVKVGWKVYRILDWQHEVAEANRKFGEHDGNSLEIKVDMSCGPARTAEVLFHECVHAIFEHASAYDFREPREDSYTEEYVCSMVSNGVMALYRDNPELAKFLAWAQTQ